MLAFFRRRKLISTWLLLLRRIKCDFYFHLNTIWKQICWVTILFYSYKKWHGMEIIVTCWVQLQPKDFLKLKSLNLHEGTFWRWIDLCWQVCSVSIQKRHVICIIFFCLEKKVTFFFPFPVLGTSVHISFTFSSTILQCLSNALTRPKSFLLLRQLIRTWVLFLTDCVRTDSGPVLNSSSSRLANSSGVISDLGLLATALSTKQIHFEMTRPNCHTNNHENIQHTLFSEIKQKWNNVMSKIRVQNELTPW